MRGQRRACRPVGRLRAALAATVLDAHGATAGYLFAFAAGLVAIAIVTYRRHHLAD